MTAAATAAPSQVADGHDMDHYADDLAAVTAHLDLKNAIHVGHSTGGGEVVHYIARHGESRVAKAAILSAVPPLMVQTAANPGGLPKSVFDDLQKQLAANRTGFYRDVASGPFYGYNRPGAKPSEAVIQNWWRQGMMGGAKAHYDGIVAFSQTDFTEDLKKITVPVLVMHGDDDQIVPYADSGPLSAKLLKNGHAEDLQGLPARHADHARRNHQRGPAGVLQGVREFSFSPCGRRWHRRPSAAVLKNADALHRLWRRIRVLLRQDSNCKSSRAETTPHPSQSREARLIHPLHKGRGEERHFKIALIASNVRFTKTSGFSRTPSPIQLSPPTRIAPVAIMATSRALSLSDLVLARCESPSASARSSFSYLSWSPLRHRGRTPFSASRWSVVWPARSSCR